MDSRKTLGITPGTAEEHKTLEQDVAEFLQQHEFLTASATYHEKMPQQVCELLQRIYTPTSLYLRGRADRIAVKDGQNPVVFEWEAKTHKNPNLHDMTLEALPLCHHIAKRQLDVECLYVYRNQHKGHECGFWIDGIHPHIPIPRVVMIPRRWTDAEAEWFTNIFRTFFPNTNIVRLQGRTRGSSDPFVIIDEEVVMSLSHWQTLIVDRL